MEINGITSLQSLFVSRLDTLNHLLDVAEAHFDDDKSAWFGGRITADMLPLGTQVAFACNQPRHFSQWCAGNAVDNWDTEIVSIEDARRCIVETKTLLENINIADAQASENKLAEIKRIEVGEGAYLELPGASYVSEFLMPNFYFHLTTAYNILRMSGVDVGKRNFMMHLVPFVKQS